MQLVLDIKKKTNGDPESYRVRVLWFLSQGLPSDTMDVDKREVIFVSFTDYMRGQAS